MSRLKKAATVALEELVGLEAGEEVLINTNPGEDVYPIALALFETANELKADPLITVQNGTNILDYTHRLAVEAIKDEPDVFLSITSDEFGQDPYGLHIGYVGRDGNKYDAIYDKVTAGDRRVRGFQACGVTVDMFERLVPIDYGPLRALSAKLKEALDGHEEVRVTSPAGTDITFSIKGRSSFKNDGYCQDPGEFGNLPAGEVYISPVIGSANGVIAFDGSLKLIHRAITPEKPIFVTFSGGFVWDIEGGKDAAKLEDTIRRGNEFARSFGSVEGEKFNGNLGEFGIGTNPHARMTGYVLEDEKVLNTVHFAIGDNYDFDANGILHQDGLVFRPTVTVDGRTIMKDGEYRV